MWIACTNFLSLLLDAVVPPRPTLRVVRSLTLPELRAIILRGDNAGALPYHDPRVRALVWELKYRANRHAATLAGEILAEVLIDVASEEFGKLLLVPMPMHAARRRERGHNQAELLCEAALQCMEGPGEILPLVRSGPLGQVLHSLQEFPRGPFDYAPHALVRERATPPQQGLTKQQRLTNVKNSMTAAHPARVVGRMCVVVDDVSTTGASFAEARRVLLAAGAREVECVALAHS